MADYNQIYFQGVNSSRSNAYCNSNYSSMVSSPCGNHQISSSQSSYHEVKRYIAD